MLDPMTILNIALVFRLEQISTQWTGRVVACLEPFVLKGKTTYYDYCEACN